MDYRFSPLGDQAVVIELGEDINFETHQKVKAVAHLFDERPLSWLVEYVPAFTTVSVFYNPLYFSAHKTTEKFPYDAVCEQLEGLLSNLDIQEETEPRIVEIPVYYGGEFGPDLDFVAEHNGLKREDVIDIHSNGDYLVYMIGFAPGFPYIGGMSEKIATPRRKSPRLKIPAGTVGIAGMQTGVYPIETPGGWQLIGRTPLKLFRPGDQTPSLLQAGDKIQFKPITKKEFEDWEDVHA